MVLLAPYRCGRGTLSQACDAIKGKLRKDKSNELDRDRAIRDGFELTFALISEIARVSGRPVQTFVSLFSVPVQPEPDSTQRRLSLASAISTHLIVCHSINI